jgi:uroporphyrinogen-III synthase
LDKSDKPLAGKRILVTRAPGQAQELIVALEKLGAEVSLLPMLSFAPPYEWQQLDEQLRRLDFFDAILFLSKNAVHYICGRCAQLGIGCEMVQANHFIAAVGPATSQALEEKGIRANYVAQKGTGESLARELKQSLAGRRVLLPRSDRGDQRLANAMHDIGAKVTEVIAYRTIEPAAIDSDILLRIGRSEVDAVVFASPSAVLNFAAVMGEAEISTMSARVSFVAIGPTTANAIRDSGARVEIEAEEPSSSGIVKALVEHFGQPSASARRS